MKIQKLFLAFLSLTALLRAQSITPGIHSGAPYAIDCTTSASGTLSFTTSGTFNSGNLFRVELSDASGSFTAYPLYVGTLSLSGINPSGTINLGIYAGLPSSASYSIRIISTSPSVISTTIGPFTITNSGGTCTNGKLIVNEMSQGPSGGTAEYIELLVLGATPCSVVDIRNMIVDDNNGDFTSGGPTAGVGIAAGHIRFTSSAQWSRVPSGTLILLYDNLNKNTSILLSDDQTDANNDMVFVIPVNGSSSSSIGIEGTSVLPTSSSAAYSPVGAYGNASWSYISLANSVDAVQTRYSNTTFMHGFSWGSSPMIAGPGFHMGTATTSAIVIYQNHTSGYTSSSHYTRGAVPTFETPGINNNSNNMTFITANTCIVLEDNLIQLEGKTTEDGGELKWKLNTLYNSELIFELLESNDAENFTTKSIHLMENNVNGEYNLVFKDDLLKGKYFKIVMYNENGRVLNSNIVYLKGKNLKSYFYYNGVIYFSSKEIHGNYTIYDTEGKCVKSGNFESGTDYIDVSSLSQGLYYFQSSSNEGIKTFKFLR
jgi:hypothetical protein